MVKTAGGRKMGLDLRADHPRRISKNPVSDTTTLEVTMQRQGLSAIKPQHDVETEGKDERK